MTRYVCVRCRKTMRTRLGVWWHTYMQIEACRITSRQRKSNR